MSWTSLPHPPDGPQPFDHAERLRRAQEIAGRFSSHYAGRLLGGAFYGSLARGSDGPFSDIEMMFVVAGEQFERNYEWSAGPWKAEVNVLSEDVFFAQARELDGDWPVTHGAFLYNAPFMDAGEIFAHGRAAALGHTDAEFNGLIGEVLVGDLYEAVGKVRNGLALQRPELIAPFALAAARFGACLVGLSNRHVYRSGSTIYSESLALPGQPAGYDALARMVMAGRLDDPAQVAAAVNAFWSGAEAWAAGLGIRLRQELDDLLD